MTRPSTFSEHFLQTTLKVSRLVSTIARLVGLVALVCAAGLMAAVFGSLRAKADDTAMPPVPAILQASAEVTASQITLGDVFMNAGARSGQTLATAPAPGRTLTLDPAWVYARGHAAGLVMAPLDSAPQRIVVRRASRTFGLADLQSLVGEELARLEGGEWLVSLSGPSAYHVPADASIEPMIIALNRDARTGRLSGEADLTPFGEDASGRVRLTGRADQALRLPVLARPVGRDEIITAASLDWQLTPARRAPADALSHAADIIGLAAVRPLRAEAPVRASDLKRPAIIKKGEAVRILYQVGALTLTARGEALSEAGRGEPVRIVNTLSRRTIDAIAEAPGLARVSAAHTQLGGY